MKVIAAKDAEMAIPVALSSCCCLCSAFSLRCRLLLICGVTILTVVALAVGPLFDAPVLLAPAPPPLQQPRPPRHNILHYIADPSDWEEKNKIRQLLDGSNGGNAYRFRYNRLQRLHFNDFDSYERTTRPMVRQRSRDRWPADLSSPRFVPYLSQFRQLLQDWARRKRYEPQVMKELVATLKDPIDRHYGTMKKNSSSVFGGYNRKYGSCAVVGNSGILLNRTYGNAIDAHDMVMRLNNAKISGFGAWVGSRTTISFVNSNILHSCSRRPRCSCQPYGGEAVPVVSYICQVAHFMDVAYCSSFHRAPLLVTDPRFDSLCTRIVRYYSIQQFFEEDTSRSYDEWNKLHDGSLFHYSSGMQAVMLALGICDSVDLFGFGKLKDAKHHYHTNQKAELALHDYEAEYAFYNDIAAGKWSSIPFLNDSGLVAPPLRIFR